MLTQLPSVPSLIPSSFATRAIGRDVSITIFTASSLNSGEKLFFGRGNYFTFPDVHPNGWTVRKLRGTSFRPCGRTRGWRMRWCGRPLTSNHHGGPDPGHKPDAGSCLEGCELALRARGPDFRLPPAPAGGRDRLPHPHDRRT